MNKFIVVICFLLLFASGCSYLYPEESYDSSMQQAKETPAPERTQTDAYKNTPTPQAKISSDFENAPNAQEISEETNKEIFHVLLQDTLTYTIPINDYFAVCLEEDAQQAYRWLLVSEDDLFEYVEETHLNGYRVFVFKPKQKGETSLLFELSQNSTLVETLSYKIIFS